VTLPSTGRSLVIGDDDPFRAIRSLTAQFEDGTPLPVYGFGANPAQPARPDLDVGLWMSGTGTHNEFVLFVGTEQECKSWDPPSDKTPQLP
jgi:hypothetical protein